MSVWLPKSELPEKFRRRLKEVFISNTFFAPVNGGMGSDWYAGGETGMEPTELQTGVLEQAVKIYPSIRDMDIAVAMAEEPPILEDQHGTEVAFRYIVGIRHFLGQSYSHDEDIKKLMAIISGIRLTSGFRFAPMMTISPDAIGIAAEMKEFSYDSVFMGDVSIDYDPQVDGKDRIRSLAKLRYLTDFPK